MNPSSDNTSKSHLDKIGGTTSSPAPWQAAQLKRWLQEWKLYCALADNSEDESPASYNSSDDEKAEFPPDFVPPFETTEDTFSPGSVRVLSPELVPDAERPFYIVLLMDWAVDRKLVAPFGPISIPASTMEFQMDRTEPHLSVVSLWNARILSSEVVAKSWFAGRLEPHELEDLLAVWNYSVLDKPLPAHLLAKVGSPIDEAEDPRCDYQNAESEVFSSIDTAMLAAFETEPLATPAEVIAGQLWIPADINKVALLILSETHESGDNLFRAVVCSPATGWPKEWEDENNVFFSADEAGLWIAHFNHKVARSSEQIKTGEFLGNLAENALPIRQLGVAKPERSAELDAAHAELKALVGCLNMAKTLVGAEAEALHLHPIEPTFTKMLAQATDSACIVLSNFFAQFMTLRVAGAADKPMDAVNEYTITTSSGDAKLTVFIRKSGNHYLVRFKLKVPDGNWPTTIAWQRKLADGTLAEPNILLVFSTDGEKIDRLFSQSIEEETWVFLGHV